MTKEERNAVIEECATKAESYNPYHTDGRAVPTQKKAQAKIAEMIRSLKQQRGAMTAAALDLTTDVNGKPWAKLSQLKPGDILIPDGGFTCMKEGDKMKVVKDHDDSLFLLCNCGGHALAGQADDGETLVGLYPV